MQGRPCGPWLLSVPGALLPGWAPGIGAVSWNFRLKSGECWALQSHFLGTHGQKVGLPNRGTPPLLCVFTANKVKGGLGTSFPEDKLNETTVLRVTGTVVSLPSQFCPRAPWSAVASELLQCERRCPDELVAPLGFVRSSRPV